MNDSEISERIKISHHLSMENFYALVLAMYEKGLLEPSDIDKQRPLAIHMIEQMDAKATEFPDDE